MLIIIFGMIYITPSLLGTQVVKVANAKTAKLEFCLVAMYLAQRSEKSDFFYFGELAEWFIATVC